MKCRIMHGHAEIWNFSSSFQLDMSLGSAANKGDIEWTREERFHISKQPCIPFFFIFYYMNKKKST